GRNGRQTKFTWEELRPLGVTNGFNHRVSPHVEVAMRVARSVALASLVVLAMACQKKEAPAPAPAAPAAAPAPAVTNEILVEHVASMTGGQATFGESTDNAIKLAIAGANAAGGVKGKKLVLKSYD